MILITARMRGLVPVLLSALLMLCLTPSAVQADPPAYWRGNVSGWVFAPAIVSGGVVGHLGWADTAVITGNNIAIVWFQRESNGTWTTWGWKSGDFCKAVDALRTSLSQPTLWAEDDDILTKLSECAPVTSAEPPTALASGLFIDDPILEAVSASEDPVQFVAALADFGWASAPTISAILAQQTLTNTGVPCDADSSVSWTADQLILRMTYESETVMFGSSTVSATLACTMLCSGCWSTTTYTAWGAWVFVGSATSPVGVLTCTYSRTRTKTRTWTGATFWSCAACPGPTVTTQTQTRVVRPVPAAAGCSPPA